MKIAFGPRSWIAITVIVVLFSLFFIGRHLVHALGIKRDIARLQREEEHYRMRIAEDSTLLEHLKFDDYLEEFAREWFHMQRPNEKVYRLED